MAKYSKDTQGRRGDSSISRAGMQPAPTQKPMEGGRKQVRGKSSSGLNADELAHIRRPAPAIPDRAMPPYPASGASTAGDKTPRRR